MEPLVFHFRLMAVLFLLLLLLLLLSPAQAESQPSAPMIVGDAARSVVFDREVRQRADDLVRASRQAPASLIGALNDLAADPALDALETDAVLHEFIRQLRSQSPGSVSAEVLAWLRAYEPGALVRHPDSPVYLVALFDVPVAAAGLANQWAFERARMEWLQAGTRIDPASMEAFVHAPHGPRAMGYRAALQGLEAPALDRLLALAAARAELAESVLLPLAALAAGKMPTAAAWLPQAGSRQAAEVLAHAREHCPACDLEALHRAALDHPDAALRSLALADRTTAVVEQDDAAGQSAWATELAATVSDPVIGDAAALQLIRLADHNPAIEVQAMEWTANARVRLQRARTAMPSPGDGSLR